MKYRGVRCDIWRYSETKYYFSLWLPKFLSPDVAENKHTRIRNNRFFLERNVGMVQYEWIINNPVDSYSEAEISLQKEIDNLLNKLQCKHTGV